MPEASIDERTEWAAAAIEEHTEVSGNLGPGLAFKAGEVMLDIFHLLEKNGIDPKEINQQALEFYEQEKDEGAK